MEKKPRTFTETAELAAWLADRIERIEKASLSNHLLRGNQHKLKGVSHALTIIADTPNASINAEARQAFEQIVDEGLDSLRGWAKAFLKPDDDLLDDDEIPF